MAYGPRFVTLYRQHALQAVKVLKGTKPADIPVEQWPPIRPVPRRVA